MNDMKMTFIGDIHGKWRHYMDIISSAENTIQVGDFGIGFKNPVALETVEEKMTKGNHKFIRGNHDNPVLCKEHQNCIKDGTYDPETGIFYMGGAFSVDRAWGVKDEDWWEDEEMSIPELGQCIDEYIAAKPRIVVTHDCPESVACDSFSWYDGAQSRTRQVLQNMFECHQPELHIFGHWHKNVDYKKNGTRFICLNQYEKLELEI
jgi:predicted phosphodiesterase